MTATMRTPHSADDDIDTEATIVHRFRRQVERHGDRSALRHRAVGTDEWTSISWTEYGTSVSAVAAGLCGAGIALGDRVAILAANRPSAHIVDLAILSAGAVSVPIHPTSSSSQVADVLADCGARICFVDDAEQLAKVVLHRDALPTLERVVITEPAGAFDQPEFVMSLEDLCGVLHGDTDAVDERLAALLGDDLATLVYSSGATGPPKGARISHDNITWTIDAIDSLIDLDGDDRWLSQLPLSHVAERITSHFGQIAAGGETWFTTSLATVPEDLRACRPTIFMAVPRVWQKLRDSVLDDLDHRPVHLGGLLDRTASSVADPGRPWWSMMGLLETAGRFTIDQTLVRAVRRSLGLDRARLLISAAAPIHPDLVRWFHGIGLPIAELYGQIEDCGAATMNLPDATRIGSVGRPLPGLDADVDDDGELLFRGGSVCSGYHGLPDATTALIDGDGWMHSGDLGLIDDDGYVWITGRKKDTIINAAGQHIAPVGLETFLTMDPLIGHAVVVGDGHRYLTALIALDTDSAAKWAREHGDFAEVSELAHDPRLRDAIEAAVGRVNEHHAAVDQIKSWRLLPEPLSVEGGELTPTSEVKRDVVRERHADLIETMYATES